MLTSISVIYLYIKVYELVGNYSVLKGKYELLGQELKGFHATTGSVIQDLTKLQTRIEELEGKLRKYEDAADRVTKLHQISPRLARGAHRA